MQHVLFIFGNWNAYPNFKTATAHYTDRFNVAKLKCLWTTARKQSYIQHLIRAGYIVAIQFIKFTFQFPI